MRKLLLSVVVATVAIMTTGCGKINDKIDRLDERLSQLEGTTIPTIDEQITNINTSVADLQKTDTELKGYITSLQTTATDLQKQITATNTKIDEVNSALAQSIADAKTDLASQIATAKSDVVAQLEALRSEMTAQLSQINTTIETLQSKDAELEGKITALQAYVDTQIGSAKDWATATFATLEQYNKVVEDIAAIKNSIESTNQSIADLETRLNGKIATDIATAVASLDEEIKQKVGEITTAYTSAIATAKEEITAAYTAAIAQAISASETSMKAWVNEQLTGYYTIAQTDAKLSALKTDLGGQLSTQKTYLENLITQLSTTVNQQIADNTAKIEALRTELSGKSDENKTAIADNAEKIAKNAEAIIANTKGIADNAELIKANATLIEANSKLIEANKTAIAELNENVDKNAKAIAKNAQAIADNALLISTNTTTLNNHTQTIAENSAAIVKLQSDLADAKTQITEAYTNAIATAISESEGRINTKIANEIAGVNTTIDNKIKSVNESITTLTAKVTALESDVASIKSQIATMAQDIEAIKSDIAKLLKRIQSVTFVPQYADGKVEMKRVVTEDEGIAEFDFAVMPKDAVTELANVWQQAVTMQAVYTKTRAVSFINLPILSLTANKRTGVITIKASGKNLSEDFFLKKTSANASLVISDGNASVASEYVPMYGKNDTSLVDDLYTILYTTSDNQPLYSKIATQEGFVSNTYENGQGKIKFDRKITYIADGAFNGCQTLTSVTLPNCLERIEGSAFYGCKSLMNIVIPDSVTYIGYKAFYECENLTSITIGACVKEIFREAFAMCYKLNHVNITDIAAWCAIKFNYAPDSGSSNPLQHRDLYLNGELVTNLVIPDNVTTISDYAFYYYTNLKSITWGKNLAQIGEFAFSGSNVAEIIIPDNVTSIGSGAFFNCDNLTTVTIGNGVILLGGAFSGKKLEKFYGKFASADNRSLVINGNWTSFAYYGLTEYNVPDGVLFVSGTHGSKLNKITIPKSVVSISGFSKSATDVVIQDSAATIEERAFYEYKGTSISLGKGITSIETYAFYNCPNIKTLDIPDSCTKIGNWAFQYCEGLTEVTIGKGMQELSGYSFDHCVELVNVYCKATTPPTSTWRDFNACSKLEHIYVPRESVDAYKAAEGWKNLASIIEGYDFE